MAQQAPGHPGPIYYDPQEIGEDFNYQTAATADALQELIGQGIVGRETKVFVDEWVSEWFPLQDKWEELGVYLPVASARAPPPAQPPDESPPAIHQRPQPGSVDSGTGEPAMAVAKPRSPPFPEGWLEYRGITSSSIISTGEKKWHLGYFKLTEGGPGVVGALGLSCWHTRTLSTQQPERPVRSWPLTGAWLGEDFQLHCAGSGPSGVQLRHGLPTVQEAWISCLRWCQHVSLPSWDSVDVLNAVAVCREPKMGKADRKALEHVLVSKGLNGMLMRQLADKGSSAEREDELRTRSQDSLSELHMRRVLHFVEDVASAAALEPDPPPHLQLLRIQVKGWDMVQELGKVKYRLESSSDDGQTDSVVQRRWSDLKKFGRDWLQDVAKNRLHRMERGSQSLPKFPTLKALGSDPPQDKNKKLAKFFTEFNQYMQSFHTQHGFPFQTLDGVAAFLGLKNAGQFRPNETISNLPPLEEDMWEPPEDELDPDPEPEPEPEQMAGQHSDVLPHGQSQGIQPDWKPYNTQEGQEAYHNSKTGETLWQKQYQDRFGPSDMLQPQPQPAGQYDEPSHPGAIQQQPQTQTQTQGQRQQRQQRYPQPQTQPPTQPPLRLQGHASVHQPSTDRLTSAQLRDGEQARTFTITFMGSTGLKFADIEPPKFDDMRHTVASVAVSAIESDSAATKVRAACEGMCLLKVTCGGDTWKATATTASRAEAKIEECLRKGRPLDLEFRCPWQKLPWTYRDKHIPYRRIKPGRKAEVTVEVVRAINLGKHDASGVGGPFVTMIWEGTHVEQNPEWDPPYQFDPISTSEADTVTFEVRSRRRAAVTRGGEATEISDPIGCVTVPVAAMDSKPQQYTLQPLPGMPKPPQGALELRCSRKLRRKDARRMFYYWNEYEQSDERDNEPPEFAALMHGRLSVYIEDQPPGYFFTVEPIPASSQQVVQRGDIVVDSCEPLQALKVSYFHRFKNGHSKMQSSAELHVGDFDRRHRWEKHEKVFVEHVGEIQMNLAWNPIHASFLEDPIEVTGLWQVKAQSERRGVQLSLTLRLEQVTRGVSIRTVEDSGAEPDMGMMDELLCGSQINFHVPCSREQWPRGSKYRWIGTVDALRKHMAGAIEKVDSGEVVAKFTATRADYTLAQIDKGAEMRWEDSEGRQLPSHEIDSILDAGTKLNSSGSDRKMKGALRVARQQVVHWDFLMRPRKAVLRIQAKTANFNLRDNFGQQIQGPSFQCVVRVLNVPYTKDDRVDHVNTNPSPGKRLGLPGEEFSLADCRSVQMEMQQEELQCVKVELIVQIKGFQPGDEFPTCVPLEAQPWTDPLVVKVQQAGQQEGCTWPVTACTRAVAAMSRDLEQSVSWCRLHQTDIDFGQPPKPEDLDEWASAGLVRHPKLDPGPPVAMDINVSSAVFAHCTGTISVDCQWIPDPQSVDFSVWFQPIQHVDSTDNNNHEVNPVQHPIRVQRHAGKFEARQDGLLRFLLEDRFHDHPESHEYDSREIDVTGPWHLQTGDTAPHFVELDFVLEQDDARHIKGQSVVQNKGRHHLYDGSSAFELNGEIRGHIMVLKCNSKDAAFDRKMVTGRKEDAGQPIELFVNVKNLESLDGVYGAWAEEEIVNRQFDMTRVLTQSADAKWELVLRIDVLPQLRTRGIRMPPALPEDLDVNGEPQTYVDAWGDIGTLPDVGAWDEGMGDDDWEFHLKKRWKVLELIDEIVESVVPDKIVDNLSWLKKDLEEWAEKALNVDSGTATLAVQEVGLAEHNDWDGETIFTRMMEIVPPLLLHPNDNVRREAAELIAHVPDKLVSKNEEAFKSAIDGLLFLLRGPEQSMSDAALSALARICGKSLNEDDETRPPGYKRPIGARCVAISIKNSNVPDQTAHDIYVLLCALAEIDAGDGLSTTDEQQYTDTRAWDADDVLSVYEQGNVVKYLYGPIDDSQAANEGHKLLWKEKELMKWTRVRADNKPFNARTDAAHQVLQGRRVHVFGLGDGKVQAQTNRKGETAVLFDAYRGGENTGGRGVTRFIDFQNGRWLREPRRKPAIHASWSSAQERKERAVESWGCNDVCGWLNDQPNPLCRLYAGVFFDYSVTGKDLSTKITGPDDLKTYCKVFSKKHRDALWAALEAERGFLGRYRLAPGPAARASTSDSDCCVIFARDMSKIEKAEQPVLLKCVKSRQRFEEEVRVRLDQGRDRTQDEGFALYARCFHTPMERSHGAGRSAVGDSPSHGELTEDERTAARVIENEHLNKDASEFDRRLCGQHIIVLRCAWKDSRNGELLDSVVRGEVRLSGATPLSPTRQVAGNDRPAGTRQRGPLQLVQAASATAGGLRSLLGREGGPSEAEPPERTRPRHEEAADTATLRSRVQRAFSPHFSDGRVPDEDCEAVCQHALRRHRSGSLGSSPDWARTLGSIPDSELEAAYKAVLSERSDHVIDVGSSLTSSIEMKLPAPFYDVEPQHYDPGTGDFVPSKYGLKFDVKVQGDRVLVRRIDKVSGWRKDLKLLARPPSAPRQPGGGGGGGGASGGERAHDRLRERVTQGDTLRGQPRRGAGGGHGEELHKRVSQGDRLTAPSAGHFSPEPEPEPEPWNGGEAAPRSAQNQGPAATGQDQLRGRVAPGKSVPAQPPGGREGVREGGGATPDGSGVRVQASPEVASPASGERRQAAIEAAMRKVQDRGRPAQYEVGAAVEIFSRSAGRYLQAHVTKVLRDGLVEVQYMVRDRARKKTLQAADCRLPDPELEEDATAVYMSVETGEVR
jgi:hypothetical protein